MSGYDAVFDALHKVNVAIAKRDTQITKCQSDIAIAKAKQQECEGKYETAKNKTNNEFPDGLPPKNRGKMTKPRERYDSLKGRQDAARWEAERAGAAVRALERQLQSLESKRQKLQARATRLKDELDRVAKETHQREQDVEKARQRSEQEQRRLEYQMGRMTVNETRGPEFARRRSLDGGVTYDRYYPQAEGSQSRRGGTQTRAPSQERGGQGSNNGGGRSNSKERRTSGSDRKGKRRAWW